MTNPGVLVIYVLLLVLGTAALSRGHGSFQQGNNTELLEVIYRECMQYCILVLSKELHKN